MPQRVAVMLECNDVTYPDMWHCWHFWAPCTGDLIVHVDDFLQYLLLLLLLQYFVLGCGGKTRQRDPEDVAADVLGNISKDPTYIKAGVVDTWKDIINVSLI